MAVWLLAVLRRPARLDPGPAERAARQRALEDLSAFLADQPDQILVGIGATRYTAFGADDRLQPGDEVTVLVYDGSVHTPEAARRSVETRQPLGPAHPQLTQRVEVP